MPYVSQDERKALKPLTDAFEALDIESAGTLNYLVTMLCRAFLKKRRRYEAFNAVVGVLECAKLELYRRWVAPYEDEKIAEHGDL